MKRDENAEVLLLDAGRTLMGPTQVTIMTKGAVIIEAMNMLGYDAMTVAEQDLQLGLEVVREREEEAEFPFLSANLVFADTTELLFAPYTIVERGGRKVGILGLTGSEGPMPLELFDGYVVDLLNPLEVASQYVAEMSAEADIIVVLSNLGLDTDELLAEEVPGIDLIVGGMTRKLLMEPLRVDATVIVQAGYRGEWIGWVTLYINSGGAVTDSHGGVVVLDDKIMDDPEMLTFVTKAKEEAAAN